MVESIDKARIVREISVPEEATVTMHIEKRGTKMRVNFDGVGPSVKDRLFAANLFAMGIDMLIQDIEAPEISDA